MLHRVHGTDCDSDITERIAIPFVLHVLLILLLLGLYHTCIFLDK